MFFFVALSMVINSLNLYLTTVKRNEFMDFFISLTAYIFVTFFVMGAAYKSLANSAPGNRTTTHSAPAQVDRLSGRGVQFINLPSSTQYKPSQSLYETDIPSAPVFIDDFKI